MIQEKKNLAIITGADGGMGTEITREVAKAGYPVLMLCYTAAEGEKCRDKIAAETGNQEMEVLQVDLSSMSSVAAVADEIISRGHTIDLLMNNAGMLANHFSQTEDGFERTVAVNYVAPYFLTRRLLPLLHAGSRIVNMISLSYVKGAIGPHFFSHGKEGAFTRIPIYTNTKLALWLFTRELSQRTAADGIHVNAADPGIVNTEIIRMDRWFDCLTDLIYRPMIRTPREGADTAIRLLLDPAYREETGKVFHSGKVKRVKARFLKQEMMTSLWNETEQQLAARGFTL